MSLPLVDRQKSQSITPVVSTKQEKVNNGTCHTYAVGKPSRGYLSKIGRPNNTLPTEQKLFWIIFSFIVFLVGVAVAHPYARSRRELDYDSPEKRNQRLQRFQTDVSHIQRETYGMSRRLCKSLGSMARNATKILDTLKNMKLTGYLHQEDADKFEHLFKESIEEALTFRTLCIENIATPLEKLGDSVYNMPPIDVQFCKEDSEKLPNFSIVGGIVEFFSLDRFSSKKKSNNNWQTLFNLKRNDMNFVEKIKEEYEEMLDLIQETHTEVMEYPYGRVHLHNDLTRQSQNLADGIFFKLTLYLDQSSNLIRKYNSISGQLEEECLSIKDPKAREKISLFNILFRR